MTLPRSRGTRTLLAFLLAALAPAGRGASGDDAKAVPRWIWAQAQAGDDDTAYFRKEIVVPEGASAAQLVAACDNEVALYLDGKPVLECGDWQEPVSKDVTQLLVGAGGDRRHILGAKCKNQGGPAGFLARLSFRTAAGATSVVVTDASWKASNKSGKGWSGPAFNDSGWAAAHVVGALGDGPWTQVNEAALDSAASRKGPSATDPSRLKVAKGFRVELLYTVPKDQQGSWVSMTPDPKGRLIVADQYGKLYRVTPPPLGGPADAIKVEPIDVDLGEAQGMLWAFDSLYVVVNQGSRYHSGLYRVTDTNGDDKLDKVEMLRDLDGGGEHGPHGVVLAPDGKSIYVVAGNATALTKLSGSLVPKLWDEDQVLPYMPDGSGFMADERAPGGCIYKVTPDGKDWTLVSMGYRNAYDLAFNKYGDLFTYDSDMEWDMNTPWYRPTRVCMAAPGSDLGYRNGSGKWPTYYPDSLPPVVNIGPGSPTGVTFGYGAKFPAKYQDALYLCDWSYGKLYAVHLQSEQAHYKAEVEEFISGSPLPLTDIVINPRDGAMYFAIGGRKTLSGLYRVTYAGTESPRPVAAENSSSLPIGPGNTWSKRKTLEGLLAKTSSASAEFAWDAFGAPDRFVRSAAREVVEHQRVATWQAKALAEARPQSSLTALLALARAGASDKSLQPKIFDALARLDWDKLDVSQKLELLRVYEVAIARMGPPDAASAAKLVARLDPLFPAKGRELNAELSRLMIALQAPSAAAKTMTLLAHAPTQEEQIDYAASLRMLAHGWTPDLRKAYFSWFLGATHFKGGNSLNGFLNRIKSDALKTVPADEMAALRPILDARPEARSPIAAAEARPLVKAWTVEELTPTVETGLKGRDFDKGRSLFAAASCFACHRYDNEGGAVGPDLTGVAGRFSPRDLLESIVLPSKSISDQYGAVTISTSDGQVVTGRIVNLNGDSMMINTNMLDPNAQVTINRKQIEETKVSPVSMMPEGLLNTFQKDEVLDLLAFLLSRGDRNAAVFRKP